MSCRTSSTGSSAAAPPAPAGSGIGLTVVAELAAAHGGTAGAASQPGQGTTFTIRLPGAGHTAAQPLPNRIFTAVA